MSVVIGASKRLRLPNMGIARYVVAPCFRLVSAIAEYRWIDITAMAVMSVSTVILSAVAIMAIAVGDMELLGLEMLLGGFPFGYWAAGRLMHATKGMHWAIRLAGFFPASIVLLAGCMVTGVSLPYFFLDLGSTLARMGICV